MHTKLLPSDSVWRDLSLYSALREHLRSIEQIKDSAPKWRTLPSSGKGSVKQLGVSFPANFSGAPISFRVTGPQFYGRLELWHRIGLVHQFWNHCRMIIGLSDTDRRYSFVLVAAALKHGGKHPPHDGHRTGSEVDLDLTCLPDLVDHTKFPQSFISLLTGETEILDEFVIPMDEYRIFEPVGAVTDDWVFPQTQKEWSDTMKRFRECGYPSTPDTEYIWIWNRIARMFTQCIYLSFPETTIFASHNISGEAREQLIQRSTDLRDLEIDKQNPNTTRIQVLQKIHTLLQRIPPIAWQYLDEKKATKTRSDHRHHWHVSYNPTHLGDEGSYQGDAKIYSEKNETIKMMLQLELWKELLADTK